MKPSGIARLVLQIGAAPREGFADRMYFTGEYTSLLFPGYMEGGLDSGATLAKRLARKVNLV